jgi:hypothetical protein
MASGSTHRLRLIHSLNLVVVAMEELSLFGSVFFFPRFCAIGLLSQQYNDEGTGSRTYLVRSVSHGHSSFNDLRFSHIHVGGL